MKDHAESVRLQKLVGEILSDFPDADYQKTVDEAMKRGETFEDACYCAVFVCFG